MSVWNFEDLMRHVDHDVRVSRYVAFDTGGQERTLNVAIECEDCYEVLVDFDAPGMDVS